MALPRTVTQSFSPPLRTQGEEYARSGRVELLHTSSSRVRATVRGAELYEVDLRAVESGRLALSCTCRYALDHGVCKHLWAVLVTCDRGGVLPSIPDEEWLAEMRVLRAADEEARAALLARMEAAREEPATMPPPISPPSDAPRPAVELPLDPRPWVQRLRALAPVMEPASPTRGETAPFPEHRRIVYLVDLPRTVQRGSGLVVELALERRQKQGGGWGVPRRFRLTRLQWLRAPEAIDREIAQMLLGASDELAQLGAGNVPDRFVISPDSIETVLRRMCETGRCRVRADAAGTTVTPLAWDEGSAWSLRLAVTPAADGASFELTGELEREGERMPLRDAALLMTGGLMIARGFASHWIDHGAFALVPLISSGAPVQVPKGEVMDLLSELYSLPRLPPVVLPPELKMDTRHAPPVPILAMRSVPATRWSAAKHEGYLAFDYGGTRVAADAVASGTLEAGERRLVTRNRPAEDAFAQRLEEAGFRWEYDFDTGRQVMRIAATRSEAAAVELVQEGWRVEVDGRPLRTAGPLTVAVRSGIDWFDLDATLDFGGVGVGLPALLTALRRGARTVRLEDDSLGVLDEAWLGRSGLLAATGTVVDGRLRFSARQLGVLDVLLDALPPADTDAAFEQARRRLLHFEGITAVDAPATFQGTLRPYQREGLGWLHFLREFALGGCLADDMGLGKTVQVLALLEARRAEGGGTSLVVVPRSLVFNWEQEAERFAPAMRRLVHRGPDRARTVERLREHDLVITTYGTLRRDVAMLREMEFDYAVLDEAQAIKNAATESAKAARLIRARHRLAMSGTPIENRVEELWSLLDFLNPGMLGKGSVFSSLLKRGEGEEREESRALLARAVRPCVLRRTKAQVAPELPERLEQTLVVELSAKERALYTELRDHYRHSLLGRIRRGNGGLGRERMHVLEALLRLRQAACHPGLVDPARRDESSSKVDMLRSRVLEATEEGHKVLVFSQFTSLLGIVRTQFDAAGITYEYLDGQTSDRQRAVERFQEDPACRVFLVSLKAGGVGLNLTAAEYVYLLDPWWNPAVEAQAIDRAHRIGQTRRVFASRLIARDTVEEKVLALQEGKRDLADAIIRADASVVANLGREELELLLS